MKDEKEYPIKGTNAMLFVPAGTKEKYQNLAGWNTIEMIEEGSPAHEADQEERRRAQDDLFSCFSHLSRVPFRVLIINMIPQIGSFCQKI